MKIRLGWTSWATGMLMLAAVAGCANNDADPPPTTPSTSASAEFDRPDDKCVTNVADRHCDRRGDRRG